MNLHGRPRDTGKPTGQDLRVMGDDVFKSIKSNQNEAVSCNDPRGQITFF